MSTAAAPAKNAAPIGQGKRRRAFKGTAEGASIGAAARVTLASDA
jgi:hypothetical protein